LTRLLAAAGFSLDARLALGRAVVSHMLADVPRILRLTPEERLLELRNISTFLAEATRSA
jgi:hypothetical protein